VGTSARGDHADHVQYRRSVQWGPRPRPFPRPIRHHIMSRSSVSSPPSLWTPLPPLTSPPSQCVVASVAWQLPVADEIDRWSFPEPARPHPSLLRPSPTSLEPPPLLWTSSRSSGKPEYASPRQWPALLVARLFKGLPELPRPHHQLHHSPLPLPKLSPEPRSSFPPLMAAMADSGLPLNSLNAELPSSFFRHHWSSSTSAKPSPTFPCSPRHRNAEATIVRAAVRCG
jgi:hypothetical protein